MKIRQGDQGLSKGEFLTTTIAAIDVGSNAIRLVIGELDRYGDIKILKKVREPVRLGQDVFATGQISPKAREKAIGAFRKFQKLMQDHGVTRAKAVATSAVRESGDRDLLIQEIKNATGISVEVIDGLEEGRLIFSAVEHRLNLHERDSLLIDIGGGSVELTIADYGKPIATQTFKLGTLRLLQMLREKNLKERNLRELINERMTPTRTFLASHRKRLQFDQAIGTGGNFECLGKLRVALLQKSSIFSMTRDELSQIATHLESMSMKDRIQFLRLRPDRADVVIPAALVTLAVMDAADIDLLMVPYVGLRDGLLSELSSTQRQLIAVK